MKDKGKTKISLAFKRVSEILSVIIFLGGLGVLIGWNFDIRILKSILPNFVTMKANTAACFVLIGASLWLLQERYSGNRLAWGGAVLCSSAVFLIGAITLCEYVFEWNGSVIDQMLFKEGADAILTSQPGRMALNTSINFILISAAALFFQAKQNSNFTCPKP